MSRDLARADISDSSLFKFFTTELGWYDEFGPVKDALAHDLIEQIMQKPFRCITGPARQR
jgi:hypothetical protein